MCHVFKSRIVSLDLPKVCLQLLLRRPQAQRKAPLQKSMYKYSAVFFFLKTNNKKICLPGATEKLLSACNILSLCFAQREEGPLPSSLLLSPSPSRCLPPAPPPPVPPAPPLSDPHVGERARLHRGQQLCPLLLPHATLHQRPAAHVMGNIHFGLPFVALKQETNLLNTDYFK